MANKYYIKYKPHNEVYKPSDILTVLDKAINKNMWYGNNKGIYCLNVPCAFDIETSNFYTHDNKVVNYRDSLQYDSKDLTKVAIMYVWQIGINGYVIIGRTWDEFIQLINTIVEYLDLSADKRRLIIYVHNLAFEFQFLRKHFTWEKVFNFDNRKPIYAITKSGIEFRCSYILSGYSLANLSNQILEYKVEKLVGDLDYQLIRHSETPLTREELAYCANDVQVVMSYIHDKIQSEKSLWGIPLTKTGYVRRYCKKHTLYVPNTRKRDKRYIDLINSLTIESDEWDLVHSAFMGGFTHANPMHSNETLYNVDSYDFTSSYPYVLLSEKFPMSKGLKKEITSKEEFEMYISKFCCVFKAAFTNIRSKNAFEHYLSISKCNPKINFVSDNGRLVSADIIGTCITEVDYRIIEQYYAWDDMYITDFYIYYKGYLPTQLVKCILKFYSDKTTLKGVSGKELEYMQGKAMLNSVYGMCVTNPIRDEFTISEDGEIWDVNVADGELKELMLDRYNNSTTRFLFYLWGIYCTAYARYNLFTAISVIRTDYVYSDTDSVKLLNGVNYKGYFESYNETVKKKLKAASMRHKLDFDVFQPTNNKGDKKLIGIWDYEGTYSLFKTLGAKRYAIAMDDAIKIDNVSYPISITVSGVNKYVAIPYLFKKANESVETFMDNFQDGLYIPSEYSGKLLHTYIDDVREGDVIDYLGNTYHYVELSAVHLEPTPYDMSIANTYANYLMNIRNEML